ncbi:MAG: hypothetical protein ABJG68_09625 [Crocinitomicaceae bacterium]
MKKLKVCLLVASLVFSLNLNAQEKGTVKFLVDVDNGYFEIVIDDTTYLKKYKTDLAAGPHTAKVWSPGYITTEVQFNVEAGKTTEKYVKMAISNERQAFEADYKNYRMQFHKSLTLPLSVSLAAGVTTSAYMLLAYDTRKQVLTDIDSYHAAPSYSETVYYKNRIQTGNKKYGNLRAGFYTSLTLTALSVGTTIFTYRRFKKNYTEPKLNSESPFKDKFTMRVSPFGAQLIFNVG